MSLLDALLEFDDALDWALDDPTLTDEPADGERWPLTITDPSVA